MQSLDIWLCELKASPIGYKVKKGICLIELCLIRLSLTLLSLILLLSRSKPSMFKLSSRCINNCELCDGLSSLFFSHEEG